MLHALEQTESHIVFVGDYVDRGPAARDVLQLLVAAAERLGDRLTLLAGNHEVGLLRFLDGGDFISFAAAGGMATIRSYVGVARGDVRRQFASALPESHERLLRERLETCFETTDLLVSHAGFDPSDPDRRDFDAMVMGSFPALFEMPVPLTPKPTVVFGHYTQRDHVPFRAAGLTCLDTGCGTTGGPLTALLLPNATLISI